jgi:glycosyltransferase involved in cell wall biosynthesis
MAVVSDLSSDARVQREAAVLVEAGHRVVVVGFDYGVRRAVRRRIDGVEYQLLPFPPRGASRPRRLFGAAFFMMRATAILLASRADAVHAHNLHLAIPCMLAAWLRRARLIYDAHELVAPMVRQRLRGLTVWYERQVWRRADAVITTNPSRARFLRRLHGGELPLVLGNYPVEPHRIEPADLRRRLSIPADHLILIYQGGLYVNDRCFEAVMDALRELPTWHWVLIGFGSPQSFTRIRGFAAAAGIDHRIHMLPKVPLHELLNLTAGADVGVVPLRHVNLNNYLGDTNKLFEYLMAGIPAVGSAFPEVHRALLDNPEGRVGAVFSPEDPSTIARAIKEVESDLPALKQRAARVGRLRYSWSVEGRKLQQLYAQLTVDSDVP